MRKERRSLLLDEVAFSVFLWRMGTEPGLLVFDEVFGVFAGGRGWLPGQVYEKRYRPRRRQAT